MLGNADRTHLICVGNDLHGDDGLGWAVYQHLLDMRWPETVQLFAGGGLGLNLLPLFENCTRVILIDALANQGQPGRIHVLSADQLSVAPQQVGHAIDLTYLLQAVSVVVAHPPTVTIIGAEIESIRPFEPTLSPAVQASIHGIIEHIKQIVAHG